MTAIESAQLAKWEAIGNDLTTALTKDDILRDITATPGGVDPYAKAAFTKRWESTSPTTKTGESS
ncbi:MAG: hypothetical protein JJE47_04375 [Acidimicrobiia bacterium]|nr:hypothetical protein [Acidimicrobiia bacterium]